MGGMLLIKENLTHWGWVTHICVGNLNTIGSDNGLSTDRRQAINRTNAGILLIEPLGTNFNETLITAAHMMIYMMLMTNVTASINPQIHMEMVNLLAAPCDRNPIWEMKCTFVIMSIHVINYFPMIMIMNHRIFIICHPRYLILDGDISLISYLLMST